MSIALGTAGILAWTLDYLNLLTVLLCLQVLLVLAPMERKLHWETAIELCFELRTANVHERDGEGWGSFATMMSMRVFYCAYTPLLLFGALSLS